MSTSETPNLHLVKPDYDELADIEVINENMDTIDAAVKGVQDSVSTLPTRNEVQPLAWEYTGTATDLNTVVAGVCRAQGGSTANMPSTITDGIWPVLTLIVGAYGHQLLFQNSAIFARRKTGSTTWNVWRKVTLENI